MIVVLDTNVLASMVIARAGGALARILDAWRRAAFVVAISEHLLEELRRTLANPYFGERLTRQDRETYLSFVQSTAQIVPLISEIAGIATHPEDDLVVATAVSAHADYLVTGDRRLRTQVPAYQGCQVMSPPDFLVVLAARENET